jgi:CRISPR system Cascade subunit CasD
MSVLLLRLSAPMQSWGVQSHFSVRDTGREPSKSGVIGLLCAALGRSRDEPIEDLTALSMGVRVDQEGSIEYDYQTAMNVFKAGGGIKENEPSRRYYLADARFLVGLEGDDQDLLRKLHAALHNPRWPLFLGRKAFVPSEPIWLQDGFCSESELLPALKTFPWLGPAHQSPQLPLRLVLEDSDGAEVRPDQPISFRERRFAPRRVTTQFLDQINLEEVEPCISPD